MYAKTNIKKLRGYIVLNNIVFIVEIFIIFGLLVLVDRFFKKDGVIAWVAMVSILANVITAKNANVLGLNVAIGTVLFASTFLATDILNENYGKEYAKKAVYIGLFSSALLIISTQIALRYVPSAIDYADGAMQTLFGLNLRISLASMVMYFIANMGDVLLFDGIRKKTDGKYLWLRNNVSTILCNCLENFGFIFLAFAGIYDLKTIFSIAIGTSVVELIAAVCDTPFLYLAKVNKNA